MFPCVSPTDGERVAHTTLIDALLEKDFQLIINNTVYNVCSPEKGTAARLARSSGLLSQHRSALIVFLPSRPSAALSLHVQRARHRAGGHEARGAPAAHGAPPARAPPAAGEAAAGETGQPQAAAVPHGEGALIGSLIDLSIEVPNPPIGAQPSWAYKTLINTFVNKTPQMILMRATTLQKKTKHIHPFPITASCRSQGRWGQLKPIPTEQAGPH